MATFDQFIRSIVSDGNDGKAFERFCKHFLETSPEYKYQFEQVWLWEDFPKKWSKDKGVDLIAKYKGRDKYCAIQAKCYAAHNTVPYNEVTNFLADSNRAEIEDRILMMSTNKLNEKTSKEVIAGQEKQVIIRDRQYFESVNYDYPSHISELSKATEKPKAKPRQHQLAAIDDVEKGLKDNNRGQLIMACGTGKTFTTLWIKERFKANTVLVLLPSLSLLSQTMREWVWGANERFEALAVCSDPTVGKSKNPEEDISNAEVGKVTWHVAEIRSFLTSEKPKVIFCTYQSSELIQEAQEDESIPQFDLVVCDEAHRCAGKANAGFATVLHEDKIRAKKRLFTTATPRYYGKSVHSAAKGRGVEIIGMDDEAKFGPVVHKLTFGQAIDMDMLTDYQVVVVGVDEPMVREWIAEGEIVSYGDDNQTDARTLAAKIAVLKAIKDYDLKRVISFHNNISRAKDFASDVFKVSEIIEDEHRPNGKIWSRHVDGKMSAGTRRDLINGLKELNGYYIGLLTNARCLSEGVDVPSLDGVAFVDPRGSQVDIIQAVGRAIRKSDKKTKGTIMLPVFLEAGDDPDSVIDASNFEPIWRILKALRSHDDALADTLDKYRTDMGLGVARASDRIEKIVFDLPINVGSTFTNALTTRIVEATSDSWEHWLGSYLLYVKETGSPKIEQTYKRADGGTLGAWVNAQRRFYKINKLSKERIKKLEVIDGWSWDPFEEAWNFAFDLFSEYVQKNKTTVIGKDVFVNEYGLGSWVHTQRQNRQRLSEEKQKKFEAFEDWLWNPRQDAWNLSYKRLRGFVEENGRLPVKGDLDKFGGKIGNWIVKQRNRRSELSEERQYNLEQIPGWVWDKFQSAWDNNFNTLKELLNEKEMKDISQTYVNKNGIRLGSWIGAQRTNFKKGKLSTQKIELLTSLPGWEWDAVQAEWDRGFRILNDFVKQYGHARVERRTSHKGFRLDNWVTQQRTSRSNMPSERVNKLERLPGWSWDVLIDEWFRHFKSLQKFYETNGHCNLPTNYKTDDGFGLPAWVRRNRERLDALSREQIEALKTIPGFLDKPEKADPWEDHYKLLLEYVAEHGHARPADNGSQIGGWVRNQRSKYKKNKLNSDKIARLEALDGWVWNVLEWQWEQGFTALKRYVSERATCSVPHDFISDNGIKLASWILSQRQRYKNSKLSEDRIKMLQDIDYWSWDPFEEAWNKGFSDLMNYVEKFGTADVSSNYIDDEGNRVGQWVHVQRSERVNISMDRKRLLESLPGWLWIKVTE
jgi:superfamily II DNA or RNA helicase